MEEELNDENSKSIDEAPLIGENITTKKTNEKAERAYKFFRSSILRAENLLEIDSTIKGGKHEISESKLLDCYRAVIVLSISALDAYVKTFLIGEIKQRISERNLSSTLKKYIKESLFNNNKDELFNVILEPSFFEIISKKFDEDFEKKSFQGQKTINYYMMLAGHDKIFNKISQNADISEDKLQSNIERFTNRRHQIVHCGDYDLNQTEPREDLITKKDADDCISLVKLTALEIHKLLETK